MLGKRGRRWQGYKDMYEKQIKSVFIAFRVSQLTLYSDVQAAFMDK